MSKLTINTDDPSWRERNLLVLLDPFGNIPITKWRFVHRPPLFPSINSEKYTIFVYGRSLILHYIIYCGLLTVLGAFNKVHNLLFIQDGLLSIILHSDAKYSYSSFKKSHVSVKNTLKEKIKSLLPMLLTADTRYIVIGLDVTTIKNTVMSNMKFLFYSNESGKLLLAAPDTLFTGKGKLCVTTANYQYLSVLENEFDTISRLDTNKGLVPKVLEKITTGDKIIFVEEYLTGVNLREILRDGEFAATDSNAINIIDRLDSWFAEYSAQFNGSKVSLSELYQPILQTFSDFHSNECTVIENIRKYLVVIDSKFEGLTPITAHNDLWPGNFIVCGHGLVAIDWERAVSGRSELFDYFWMLISTYLEYDVGKYQTQNYSSAFRRWLNNEDHLGEYIHEKLRHRLLLNGLSEEYFELFLGLFLIEWSMQGRLALGRETDMDKLALGVLRDYLNVSEVCNFFKIL